MNAYSVVSCELRCVSRLRRRQRQHPGGEQQRQDPEQALDRERSPESMCHATVEVVGVGEALSRELAGGGAEVDRGSDRQAAQDRQPAVPGGEQGHAVQAPDLDDAADDRGDDRWWGELAEAAHGVHEVLVAGPDEHSPCEQQETAEPDRRAERLDDATQVTEQLGGPARPADAEGQHREPRNGDAHELCGRVGHTVGLPRDPAAGEDEQQPGEQRLSDRGVEQVAPRGGADRPADRVPGELGGAEDDDEDRRDGADHPDHSEIAQRDQVLDALVPVQRDQDEAAEQGEDPEEREEAGEAQRAADAGGAVVIGGRGAGRLVVGVEPSASDRCRRVRGRRRGLAAATRSSLPSRPAPRW